VIEPWEWLLVLAVSWALFGLIWTVQLVHYPSFRFVPDFTDFHGHHTASISVMVGPLMVVELVLAIWLVYRSHFHWAWLLPLLAVSAIWAITFFRAVPLHDMLADVRDAQTIESLIRVNWLRTWLWSIKTGWVSYLFLSTG
jgi:hypothetical protein